MPKSLALRLIIPLTFLVAVVSGAFGWVNLRIQKEQLIEEMVIGIEQLSSSITAATWHAMLLDQRETAYQVMRAIGQKQNVESLRYFNKEGQVTFSTDPGSAAQVDKNAEACFLCHVREQPLVKLDRPDRSRIFSGKDGSRKLGMVTPIYNEAACSTVDCHAHPAGQQVLGVLDIVVDVGHVDRQVAGIQARTVWMTVVQVALIGALIFLYTRRSVTRPIRRLIRGTRAVAEMDLDRVIDVGTTGELSELAVSFNAMRERLKEAMARINAFTRDLEGEVESRGRQLDLAQRKLIQGDRMASLGQLAASVAHEINNPVQGVLTFSMLLQRMIEGGRIPEDRVDEFRRYLQMITDETARVGRIVSDLLSFSRRSKPQSTPADLNSIIEHTISLLAHRLELGSVELELEIDSNLPRVACDKSQMQQVLINLVMNAAEAMPKGGTITVRTGMAKVRGMVQVEVEDTGTGIPDEILSRIFDPFTSTKEEGKGVGLGLAVVYGIVDSHGGVIDVQTEVGRGTTFTVTLPVGGHHPPAAPPGEDGSRAP